MELQVHQRARMVRARLSQLPRFLATALAVVAEAPVPSTWFSLITLSFHPRR